MTEGPIVYTGGEMTPEVAAWLAKVNERVGPELEAAMKASIKDFVRRGHIEIPFMKLAVVASK